MTSPKNIIFNLLNSFFPIFFAFVIVLVAIPVITYYTFDEEMVSADRIMNRNNTGLTLLDSKGQPFFTFYQAKTIEHVPLKQIPQHVQDTVIAIEDKTFYTHQGFSLFAIIRSAVANIQKKEIVYGGSTITQQLVKNAFLSPQKSFIRKYQELALAQEIERTYSKGEILEMYLNSVYFGEGAFGIEQASEVYFDKNVSELSLAESALLAGLLPSPSYYSPLSGNREEAFKRQKLVLEKMVEEGYITQQDKESALHEKIKFNTAPSALNKLAPHFALFVRDQLTAQYGEEKVARDGMQVITTLKPSWQRYAERVVRDQVNQMEPLNVSNGGAIVLDTHTGEIYAMVGSKDWYDEKFGKVNITTSLRQPGSSFKPLLYATALDRKVITLATILHDVPTTFEGNYKPVDYDRRYRGFVTARRALANSLNIPAVEVITKVGVTDFLDMTKKFGITSLGDSSEYGPSLALGAGEVSLLELTNAYATFADDGIYKEPTAIKTIQDKYGNKIYSYIPHKVRIISSEAAFLISSILSDKFARAEVFGNALNTTVGAAVKTGTTDDYRDSWTIGYTPAIAVGVWVGNNDNTPMHTVAGSLGAGPIWRNLIDHFSHKQAIFNPPSGVVKERICRNGLKFPKEASAGAGISEYFIKGTEPIYFCNLDLTPTALQTAQ